MPLKKMTQGTRAPDKRLIDEPNPPGEQQQSSGKWCSTWLLPGQQEITAMRTCMQPRAGPCHTRAGGPGLAARASENKAEPADTACARPQPSDQDPRRPPTTGPPPTPGAGPHPPAHEVRVSLALSLLVRSRRAELDRPIPPISSRLHALRSRH